MLLCITCRCLSSVFLVTSPGTWESKQKGCLSNLDFLTENLLVVFTGHFIVCPTCKKTLVRQTRFCRTAPIQVCKSGEVYLCGWKKLNKRACVKHTYYKNIFKLLLWKLLRLWWYSFICLWGTSGNNPQVFFPWGLTETLWSILLCSYDAPAKQCNAAARVFMYVWVSAG